MKYLNHFYINLAWRSQYVGVFEMEYQGVKFYLIDNEFYFGGSKPYGYIHEDIEKFAFFSQAALSAIPVIGQIFTGRVLQQYQNNNDNS